MTNRRGAAVLLALVAAAYGATLANDFVFDDAIFVTRDERVRELSQTHRLFVEPLWGFHDTPGNVHIHQYYRPLQTAPLAVSLALFGDSAVPAHLLNIVTHTLNCTLVMWLFAQAGLGPAAALLAAAVFAVHPAWSESIIWISDFAGLGSALSLLLILRLHSLGRIAVSPLIAASFLAGLWCKEVAVLAPALMLAYDTLIHPRSQSGRARPRLAVVSGYVALVPTFAVYAALRIQALGAMLPGLGGEGLMGGIDLAANAFGLVPSYLSTFIYPLDLNMYHDFEPVSGFGDTRVLVGMATAIALVIAAVSSARQHSSVTFACIWIAMTAAPYLLVRWPKLNVFAERYTYLPGIGAVFLVALIVDRVSANSPHLRKAAALVVCAVTAVSVSVVAQRSTDWRDEVTIYEKTLSQSLRAELIRNNLALRLLELGRPEEGIAHIEALLEIDPEFADAYHNMGLLQLAVGDNTKALSAFERAREFAPNKPATLLNLGYMYDLHGRREKAVRAYMRLVTTDPNHTAGWYNLAVVAMESGQVGNARAAAERVTALSPHDQAARTLLAGLSSVQKQRSAQRRELTRERCKRAHALIQTGLVRDAHDLLKAASWLDEDAALPHHYLSNLYFLTGRPRLALEAIRTAKRLAPGVELYRQNAAQLEKALAESNNLDPAQ